MSAHLLIAKQTLFQLHQPWVVTIFTFFVYISLLLSAVFCLMLVQHFAFTA